jgi:trimethylamine--corrinoid protein Co-methyltransferase
MGGPGHYLGSDQTLGLMQTEYVYPRLGDRTSPKEWLEIGRPDLVENAIKEKVRILSEHFPRHIDAATDAAVRAANNIHLSPGAVGL